MAAFIFVILIACCPRTFVVGSGARLNKQLATSELHSLQKHTPYGNDPLLPQDSGHPCTATDPDSCFTPVSPQHFIDLFKF